MKTALNLFINDFKKSAVYSSILADSQLEVVMIWVTGSTLTGVVDAMSDYDLCVFCIQKPQKEPQVGFRLYTRPGSYFLKYKIEDKKVQWIYNDIFDIITPSKATPLDNIGWAQFKNISTEFIIYKNPKHELFINYLIDKKEQIFLTSAYLFIEALLTYTNSNNLLELSSFRSHEPNKGLYHVCWLADSLQNNPVDIPRLLRIKRNLVRNLAEEDTDYLTNCCKYLMEYQKQFNCKNSFASDLIQVLQELR